MDLYADIKEIKYEPLSCSALASINLDQLGPALDKSGAFLLSLSSTNQLAVSWWVSPKRTRSYPYARVYDTLVFTGKKVTIIPIMKDEGNQGDRDYLQWDTIALMSLLGVHVVIAYYADAVRSPRYRHKITDQRYDLNQIKREINKLGSYQSDALHWNLSQIDNIEGVGQMALKAYADISQSLDVDMHSLTSAEKRISVLREDKAYFMDYSRTLAQQAQKREFVTTQPKEQLTGIKAKLTIKNFLGGHYYWTCDEIEIHENHIFLIEGKHTRKGKLPSSGDIKDALVKMMLFTNLENLTVGGINYIPVPILKLTTGAPLSLDTLSNKQRDILQNLSREADANGFRVLINDEYLSSQSFYGNNRDER